MQRRVLCNYLIPWCIMHHLLFDICVIDGSVRVVCWNESSITAPSQSKLKNMGRALIIIGCHIIMMNDVNNFVHMIWANAAKHYLSHFDLHYVCLDAGAPGLELAFKSWSIDLFLWRIKIIPSPSGRLSVGRPQMESNGLIWFQGKGLLCKETFWNVYHPEIVRRSLCLHNALGGFDHFVSTGSIGFIDLWTLLRRNITRRHHSKNKHFDWSSCLLAFMHLDVKIKMTLD